VTAGDGTGIVHLAPAFGADDYASGQRHGLPMLRPIDDAGRFVEETPLVGGMFVKEADPVLVEDLKTRGLVFRVTQEVHTYPHCWRCGSPLLYMARDSWFLRTTAVKDTMVEHNRGVDWHPPETGSNRFGEWLDGNIDWAISRERYWGTPLPAWVCTSAADHVEFIGSLAELEAKAGGLPPGFDPHKPYIDDIAWTCTLCDGTMKRTPEVIDVWFDSGAMPYAQWHYPFENQDLWRRHFPADFICEAIDQTRGWFYSLLAIATMLGDEAPFRAVVVNDLILDAEGQKMSKSKGNVVDPWKAIDEFGADAIRWYLITVSQPWVPKRFDTVALSESARRTFDTLANTYRFFALYAGLSDYEPSEADPAAENRPLMDRWVLSRLGGLVERVSAEMQQYEVTRAARAVSEFIVDDLSNWYVRRSRSRFWGTRAEPRTEGSADGATRPDDGAGSPFEGTAMSVDTRAAFATLHDVLVTVSRLLAPVVPFHADWLHRALAGTSVHLASWPETRAAARNPALERGMDTARELVRLGRAARERAKIRVRQPLRALHAVVPRPDDMDPSLLEVVADELNIREILFLTHAEELVTYRATPNFRTLGKRFGAHTQRAAAAVRSLPSTALGEFLRGQALVIELDGVTHTLGTDEVEVREEARGDLVVEATGAITVALDPAIDEALRLEGLAREMVNRIQRLRRDIGFAVSDRIRLHLFGNEVIRETVARHGEVIARETLAVSVDIGEQPPERAFDVMQEVDLDGVAAWIALSRA
jgi:isoleucyl-tRNA synthetase